MVRRTARLTGALVVAALITAMAGCDVAQIVPSGGAPVRYRDQIFGSVVKTADISYGSATNLENEVVPLTLDMYQPPSDAFRSRPAIVWIHGGGFRYADKTSTQMVEEATAFAEKGYVTVSINYRLEPTGGCYFPTISLACVQAMREATADAQGAVRFLRTHAATYGIDPSRIAIAGSSAGAITALHVGYATSENPASAVRAAVSMSGANLLGAINAADAPALMFQGTADPLVPYSWAVATMNTARAAHLTASLETYEGAGHDIYPQHREIMMTQTANFLWWEMDLAQASGPHS